MFPQRMSSLSDWVLYLILGRLLIYLWQEFPLPEFLQKYKSIEKLHSCDLCSGVWVYGALSFVMTLDLLRVLGFWYVPLVSELITGASASFLTHLLRLGWNARFHVEVI